MATRRRAAAIALVVVILALNEAVLTRLMFERRQDELISQFTGQADSAKLEFGDALAVLQIPSIDLNQIVAEGNSPATLRGGPAHVLETALPGLAGNSVIMGKTARYGAPFARLKELEVGDEIVVQVKGAPARSYFVTELRLTYGSDASPYDFSTSERLTLVTSGGGWLSRDQFVVVAEPPVPVLAAGDASKPTRPYEPPGVEARAVVVLIVWILALSALVAIWARVRRHAGALALIAVFLPMGAFASMQLLQAAERLLPQTR